MSILDAVADWIYAAFRSPRESDAGECGECGSRVAAFSGRRELRGIYCSDECVTIAWSHSMP